MKDCYEGRKDKNFMGKERILGEKIFTPVSIPVSASSLEDSVS